MEDERCEVCNHLLSQHRPDGGACYLARCRCSGSAVAAEAAPEPEPVKKKAAKKKVAKKKAGKVGTRP